MFEVGKYYAQFCYNTENEWVFVERVDNLWEEIDGQSDSQINVLSIIITKEYITQDLQSWSPAFDDYKYLEIEKSLFDEIISIIGDNYDFDDSKIASHYLAIFKDKCAGNWRNLDEED